MELQKACQIMNITLPIDTISLRKVYLKKALSCHPDKNSSVNANIQFSQLNDAYQFLSTHIQKTTNDEEETISFTSSKVISILKNISQKITIKAFEEIDKETAFVLYKYLIKYSNLFNIDNDILKQIHEIVSNKCTCQEIILINPSIDNLMNEDVYKLEHYGHTLCVPMWHSELVYEINGKNVVVKCVPELPDNVTIDFNGDLLVKVSSKISELLYKKNLDVNVGNQIFKISSCHLLIKEKQFYTLKNKGIPSMNIHDIYNTINKCNIIVEINLYP